MKTNCIRASILIAIIILSLSTALNAQTPPFNTQAEEPAMSDTNGFLVWPTDPIADSFNVTNYSGGGATIQLGYETSMPAGAIFFETNFTSKASFTVYTNGHIQTIDQYGFIYRFATNGVFNITAPNGLSCLVSNFNLTLSSNWVGGSALVGTIACSNLEGTLNASWVTNLFVQCPSRSEFLACSNFLANNALSTSLLTYDTNFCTTNMMANVTNTWTALSNQIVSVSTLFGNELNFGTNQIWTSAITLNSTTSNTIMSLANFNITTAEFACSNDTQVVSNILQGFILAVSNNVVVTSNQFATIYISSLNTVSNYLNDVSNNITQYNTSISNCITQVTSNSLASVYRSGTNDFYNGPMLDFIQSYTASVAANSSSPATISLHNAWPNGNYAIWITPQDANTANFLITNSSGSPPNTQQGYYINNVNGTGWQLNFFQQVPPGFNLNFMVLCQYYHQ